jgi:hypothetical protein
MVTLARKFVAIEQAKRIFEESQGDIEIASMKLDSLPKRQQSPAPPAGGISIRAASRKYKIQSSTISRWVKRGILKPILKTKNELYIFETDIFIISQKYNQSRGRGKREIIKDFKRNGTLNNPATAPS